MYERANVFRAVDLNVVQDEQISLFDDIDASNFLLENMAFNNISALVYEIIVNWLHDHHQAELNADIMKQ